MIEVIVTSVTIEALGICSLELRCAKGEPLPAFSAGAHIDLYLPGGLVRQYSLCNAPGERHRYLIGVLKGPGSRGGSKAVHELIRCGDRLQVGEPRNLFPLVPHAERSLLFAGGIGLTPLLSMAEHLSQSGEAFELHYCVRSRDRAAFLTLLEQAPYREQVRLHFDDEPATRLDAASVLAEPKPEQHVYVCGPSGFMEYILDSARAQGWPEHRLHREYFTAPTSTLAEPGAFSVKLNSTGEVFDVPADKTVAQVLLSQGIDIPVSCEQGLCGTCLTRVLEGVPDHRDLYQTEEEQALNDHFTPCCSRSKTPMLVLDL